MKKFFKIFEILMYILCYFMVIYYILKDNTLESLWWVGMVILYRLNHIDNKLEENANSSQNTIK